LSLKQPLACVAARCSAVVGAGVSLKTAYLYAMVFSCRCASHEQRESHLSRHPKLLV
jgi:hypothetical protein